MSKDLKCTEQTLTNWLLDHLDDCPCDWHVQDYYCDKGLSIIFHTEEEEKS